MNANRTAPTSEQAFVQRYLMNRARGYPMVDAAKVAARDLRADAQQLMASRAVLAKAAQRLSS